MKLKLSAALPAALMLTFVAPAWSAEAPGDERAVSQATVDEIVRAAQTGWTHLWEPPARSGEQFVGRSDDEALQVAAKEDPKLFAAQPTEALDPPPGSSVKTYLDDFSARIDLPGQAADALAYSPTPLRVEQDGEKRPVDLKLTDAGDATEPKTPIVPASFPDALGQGITIGENIHMRIVGVESGTEAQTAGQQVFWGNALKDADVFATPVPLGVETFVQLRSLESPRTIVYAFELPDGGRLVQQPGEHGGVAIMRGDEQLASVAAPVSKDANDEIVPTTMRVEGSRVILDVMMTDATPLPVLVDPVVIDNQFTNGDAANANGSFQNTLGWRRETSGALANFTFSPNGDNPSTGGPCMRVAGGAIQTLQQQLCVSTQSSRTYAGEVGQWAWRPPGGSRSSANDGANIDTDAYIYRADVRHSYTRFSTSGGAFMYAGMRSGRTGNYIGRSNEVLQGGTTTDFRNGQWSSGAGGAGTISNPSFFRTYCAATDCSVEHPSEPDYDGAWFTFGAYALGNGHALSANAQGAIFYQFDRTAPTVQHSAVSDLAPWRRTGTVTTQVSGTDLGMGMKNVGTTYTNTQGAATIGGAYSHPCTGGILSNCPRTLTQPFGLNLDNVVEGISPISSVGIDVLGKSTVGNAQTVRVDRSAPGLDVTGTLKDAADDVAPNTATVRVAATDGSAAAPRSGVRSIEITVDGNRAFYDTQACDQSCPMTRDWTYQAADYGTGKHTIKVIARDGVDLAATDTWDIYSDDAGPEIATGGTLVDVTEQTIAEPSYDLVVEAGDGAGTSGGTGVTRLQISVDGQSQLVRTQPCADGGCSLSAEWDFDTSQFGDGEHTITVTARDSAGNENSEEWTVTVKLPANLAHDVLSIAQAAERTLTGTATQRAGQSVANVGDANGDGIDDYAVGAPGAAFGLKIGSGSVYVISGAAGPNQTLDQAKLYRIDGALPADAAGTSVSSAGDLNGDGLADLLVGAPGTGLTGGKVYAIFGRYGGATVDLANLGDRGFTITGPAAPAALLQPGARLFGTSIGGQSATELAPAGDVNGDGLADIIVGSPLETANAQTSAGAAYVIFGKANTTAVNTASLGSAGFAITGAAANHQTGYAVALVGDVNQDDLSDIAITAPGANASGRTDAGSAYIVFGKGDTTTVNTAALSAEQGLTIRGSTGDALGNSIAGLGDTDGDNIEDLAIGGSKTYVVRNQDAPADIDLSATDLAYQAVPNVIDSAAKAIVAPGGDLNADGMADLVTGFPTANGATYALLSQEGRDVRTQPVFMDTMPGEQGSQINGGAGEQLGRDLAVLSTSDNTDPAIVIGAPAAGGPTSTGATYTVRSTALRGGPSQLAAAAQAGSPPPVRNGCYTGRNIAYLWTDPVVLNQSPNRCRRTAANNVEQTKKAPKNGFRNGSRGYGNRQPTGGNVRRPLRPGKRLNNRQRTPLYDSKGDLMGYLQQLANGIQFRLFDANEQEIDTNPDPTLKGNSRDQRLQLEFEGTPCMDSSLPRTKPGEFALMSVRGPGVNSPISGLRALVRRSDLPGGPKGRDFLANKDFPSAPNDQVLDSGWVPCTRPAGFKNLKSPAVTPFTKQNFAASDTYQGGQAAGKCRQNVAVFPQGEFTPGCGTSYINYEFPRLSLPGMTPSVVGSGTSTGIGGGGITRAVLRTPTTGSPLGVRVRDEIGYVDRNVPCTKAAKAKWKLVSVQGMYLWLAYNDDALPPAERDAYVRGKTANPPSPKCAQ